MPDSLSLLVQYYAKDIVLLTSCMVQAHQLAIRDGHV